MPDVRCCCVNISEGGMAVSTSVALSPGEDVQVQFTLPGHQSAILSRIENLLVEGRAFSEFDLCFFAGAQI